MKQFITLFLVLSLITPQTYSSSMQVQGSAQTQRGDADKVGNGDDDPRLALNDEQIRVLQRGFSLDHLKLDAKGIKARDRKLAPVYKSYQNHTLASVANALKQTFGINVYHHSGAKIDFNGNVSKSTVMAAAVRFFMENRETTDHWSRDTLNGEYFWQSPLRDTPEAELGYRDEVALVSYPEVLMRFLEGDGKFFKEEYRKRSPYALTSSPDTTTKDGWFFDKKKHALFTTTNNGIFTVPGMTYFLEAMKELNLKGLDATVVFTTANITDENKAAPYRVVYPTFSYVAPIPQPVIFINASASKADAIKLLSEHAAQIYAYNKLFDREVLPKVSDLNDVLSQHPNFLEDVKKQAGDIKGKNIRAAVQHAFLSVAAGTGLALGAVVATPLTLAAMLASPIYYPILVKATVVVLLR